MMIALARWIGSSRSEGKIHAAPGAAQKNKRLSQKNPKRAKKSDRDGWVEVGTTVLGRPKFPA